MKRSTTALLAGGALLAARAIRRRIGALDLDGAAVLITGGSRGLGLELARVYADAGARLALVARSEDALARARQELVAHGAEVVVRAADLREPGAAADAVRWAAGVYGRLDVLVNNAGIIGVGPLEHLERKDFEDAFALHVWAPLEAMQAFAEGARRQPAPDGGTRIVNIASFGGLVSVPHMIPYATSKFALVGLSDGMRTALARDDIHVTTVAPGLLRTGSHVNAGFKGQHEAEFAWFSAGAGNPLLSMDAGRAARKIVEASRVGQARLTLTFPAKLAHAFDTFAPGLTASALKLAERLLPDATGASGDTLRMGYESTSAISPSVLTALADREVGPNNELPAEKP